MPTRRHLKRRAPRRKRSVRRARSRARKSGPVQSMHYNKQPFPRELFTEFTYADDYTMTANTGVPTSYTYAMNGLFDPNLSGAGTQPRYLDTLLGPNNSAAPYRSYVVMASRIKIRIFVDGTSADSIAMRSLVGLTPVISTGTAPTSLEEMLMRKECKTKWLGYWTSTQGVETLRGYQKVKTWLGLKNVTDDGGSKAPYNGNPTNLVYWIINAAPLNESATVVYRFITEITYYCKLYTVNDVADS